MHNDLLYSALACSYSRASVLLKCMFVYMNKCMYSIYMSMCVKYTYIVLYVCMFFT